MSVRANGERRASEPGTAVTAHCPNSGRMTTCAEPGFRVLLSRAANPARRWCFPDAVTERGRKHLLELMDVVRTGGRGVMLYVIQREVLVWRAEVGPAGIELAAAVPWRLL